MDLIDFYAPPTADLGTSLEYRWQGYCTQLAAILAGFDVMHEFADPDHQDTHTNAWLVIHRNKETRAYRLESHLLDAQSSVNRAADELAKYLLDKCWRETAPTVNNEWQTVGVRDIYPRLPIIFGEEWHKAKERSEEMSGPDQCSRFRVGIVIMDDDAPLKREVFLCNSDQTAMHERAVQL